MKKILICIIFLVGIFTQGFSSPPPDVRFQVTQTEFVQAPVLLTSVINVYSSAETPVFLLRNPVVANQADKYFQETAIGFGVYDPILRLTPSLTLSTSRNHYKHLAIIVPDNLNKKVTLSIRDKL